MAHITIYGYQSFDAWCKAGYPGAESFDEDGNRKGRLLNYADRAAQERADALRRLALKGFLRR